MVRVGASQLHPRPPVRWPPRPTPSRAPNFHHLRRRYPRPLPCWTSVPSETVLERAHRIWHCRGASATHEDTTPPISRLNLSSYFGIVRRGRDASNTQGGPMRYTPFAPLFGYLVLAVSSALAQTTTPPGT